MAYKFDEHVEISTLMINPNLVIFHFMHISSTTTFFDKWISSEGARHEGHSCRSRKNCLTHYSGVWVFLLLRYYITERQRHTREQKEWPHCSIIGASKISPQIEHRHAWSSTCRPGATSSFGKSVGSDISFESSSIDFSIALPGQRTLEKRDEVISRMKET